MPLASIRFRRQTARIAAVALPTTALLFGCAHTQRLKEPQVEAAREPVEQGDANSLPDTYSFIDNYRSERFLKKAVVLQAMFEPARIAQLQSLAADPHLGSDVFVLCRMLFDAKPGSTFDRPAIGGALFIGSDFSAREDEYARWPLEPLTLRGGVPILVVKGYILAGVAESPQQYLEYCLKDCRWRDVKYAPTSTSERTNIVERFLAEHPELSEQDREFVREQAE